MKCRPSRPIALDITIPPFAAQLSDRDIASDCERVCDCDLESAHDHDDHVCDCRAVGSVIAAITYGAVIATPQTSATPTPTPTANARANANLTATPTATTTPTATATATATANLSMTMTTTPVIGAPSAR